MVGITLSDNGLRDEHQIPRHQLGLIVHFHFSPQILPLTFFLVVGFRRHSHGSSLGLVFRI
jgi:hypothetical protein